MQVDRAPGGQGVHGIENEIHQRLAQSRGPANDGHVTVGHDAEIDEPPLQLRRVAPTRRSELGDVVQQHRQVDGFGLTIRRRPCELQQPLHRCTAIKRGPQ